MKTPVRLLLLVAALVGGVGCTSHTALSPEDRGALERSLLSTTGSEQFLKLSFYVTPFFGDATKKLLSPVPPEEVRLLEEPGGANINPGPVEKVLPAGSRARILQVEFPTAYALSGRVLYTPRTQPWVLLKVEGGPPGAPVVLVLRPEIKTREEFLAELGRYLTAESPTHRLEGLSAPVREAVATKRAIPEMPADALEMAWGYPERIKQSFEESSRKEEWIYPGGNRRAYLTDGRVSRLEGAGAP